MDQAASFEAGAALVSDQSGLGHPELALFDSIRGLFVATGIRPEPPAYELFWLHLKGLDPALSCDLERAIAERSLSPARLRALREAHLGDIAQSELQEIMRSAQGASERLADRLASGRGEVEKFGETLATEDRTLSANGLSPADVLAAINRLRAANARILVANRRLEADLDQAMRENGTLLERLQAAERAARTDPLTGLLNRRGLLEALRRQFEEAIAMDQPLGLAFVDIDHFKKINDKWGHEIGDEVLRFVGGFLAHCLKVREACFAARYGGEEFILVLPGMGLKAATAAVEAIRAALARQIVKRASDGATLGRLSFSAGVAEARPSDTVELLLARADAAADAAKQAGRDRVLPELPDAPGTVQRPRLTRA
ncbi:diguanylate cyclase [Thermaurantiacus sp.]